MSKYAAIRDFLARSGRETVTVSFDELGAMVPRAVDRVAGESVAASHVTAAQSGMPQPPTQFTDAQAAELVDARAPPDCRRLLCIRRSWVSVSLPGGHCGRCCV